MVAENTKILTAEREAQLRQPIDEYVGAIQAKINDLRADGTDKVVDIQNTLDSQREICVDIQVKTPSTQAVDVTVYLQAQEGYDLSEVSARVSTALNGYFSGTLLGAGVLRARLGNLVYNVPGVANYNLVKPAADVTPAAGVLPVAGTLTVGAM